MPSETLLRVIKARSLQVWRGFHFYFTHRLIHINMLYKFVHSLHHRNVSSPRLNHIA